ncbi:MAG TPA: nucleotidyl transferase AbiEii/AbiGii toxin family protein [Vicinamibacteria bacterium]
MNVPLGTGPIWHPEVIEQSTDAALRAIAAAELGASFYLAGGTGLALRLGHRRSVDLDFFTEDRIDEDALLRELRGLGPISVMAKAKETLDVHLLDTKVSFLGYPYPVLFSLDSYSGIPVADPRDIACMKISAISSRGTRRDFTDLYWVCKTYGLDELLGLFERKYASVRFNRVHVLKSLVYFEDAEKDPPPALLIDLSWQELKDFFLREIPRLL